MLACYALAAVQWLHIAACLTYSLSSLASGTEPYIERVILVLHVLYETMPLSVPLLHWHLGPALAAFFNGWLDLQVRYYFSKVKNPLTKNRCSLPF